MKNNLNKKLHYVQSDHNIESLTQFKPGYIEEINEPTKLIAAAIAARDKEWIEWLMQFVIQKEIRIGMKDLKERRKEIWL